MSSVDEGTTRKAIEDFCEDDDFSADGAAESDEAHASDSDDAEDAADGDSVGFGAMGARWKDAMEERALTSFKKNKSLMEVR